MTKETGTPQIRFSGYNDTWEQRKFSDIASRESVSRESAYDLPSVEYEDVIAEEGRLNKDISLKENIKKGIVFDGSQVLYGKLRPYLHNWLNPDFSGVAVGDWWVLKPNNVDKSFIYRLIQTQRFDDIANQSVGSKMPRADWNLVSNAEFTVPVSLEEQEKIGEYFEQLDNLITLHQRKYDKLVKVKKSMLKKMFPREGAKVPEIRFYGFTDDWEQRKFGDEFKLSQGLQVPVEEQFAEQLENTEQFIRIIDVTQEGEPPRYIYNPTGKGRVKTDDIFFVRYGAVGTIGYGYNGVIANNLFKAEPLFKACNMFLFQQFSGTDFNKKLKEMSASTSMPAVNFGALNNLTFSIPSYEEQNKIGEYFGQLDNLITLHQRKLEKLKNLKKACFKKMFI